MFSLMTKRRVIALNRCALIDLLDTLEGRMASYVH